MADVKRATMADIAKLSGYSKAAVSFAFNQPERISRETYERIMEAAKELDYLPDPMAQSLSKGRLNVVGFILPQKIGAVFDNPYSLDVMKGVAKVCEDEGSTLNLISPLNYSIEEAIKGAMVDGIITLGCTLSDSIRAVIRKRHLPVVSIDGNSVADVVSVKTDDELAAETQMTRAIELGHRKFAIVSLAKNAFMGKTLDPNDTISRRIRGYKKALEKAGLRLEDQLIITADPSFDEGMKAAEEIFSSNTGATCIICMADITAFGLMSHAMHTGVRIPEDYSVVGFDGIGYAHEGGSGLATVKQPGFEKGRTAASELFREIRGSAPGEDGFLLNIPFTFESGKTLARKDR